MKRSSSAARISQGLDLPLIVYFTFRRHEDLSEPMDPALGGSQQRTGLPWPSVISAGKAHAELRETIFRKRWSTSLSKCFSGFSIPFPENGLPHAGMRTTLLSFSRPALLSGIFRSLELSLSGLPHPAEKEKEKFRTFFREKSPGTEDSVPGFSQIGFPAGKRRENHTSMVLSE